jgi:hypothetical protein
LGQEAKVFVDVGKGLLVLDDTTLDKPYAQKMDRVTYHWSGQHQGVVQGITLWTLLWTEGKALIPCDFRVYDKPQGGKTKRCCGELGSGVLGRRLMDSWYASLKNLGWFFLTRLKSNRRVNPDRQGNRPIREVEIPPEGRVVHRKGFGLVRVRTYAVGRAVLRQYDNLAIRHYGYDSSTWLHGWLGFNCVTPTGISDGFPKRGRGILGDP